MAAELEALIAPVRGLAAAAGRAAMVHYHEPETVTKADGSPLTRADLAAHDLLCAELPDVLDVPVLSEESAASIGDERLQWSRFWLVDPLDGTKEFVKRNGEFTVNVALIADGRPVLGVVDAPALGLSYWGVPGYGAGRADAEGESPIRASREPAVDGSLRVVASRSHRSEAVDHFLARLGPHECQARGSSLKLCLVAEGSADLYPRFGPTCEWDTAAADAVATAAGATVTDLSGAWVRYGKPDLHNPWFVVAAPAAGDWRRAVAAAD